MCYYNLNINRCGHLSSTFKNTDPCTGDRKKCLANPNGEASPHLFLSKRVYASTSLNTASVLTSTAGPSPSTNLHEPPLLQPLVYSDAADTARVLLRPNLRSKCASCAPAPYARMMERDEAMEHVRCVEEDEAVSQLMADVVGEEVLEELDEMIAEGLESDEEDVIRGLMEELDEMISDEFNMEWEEEGDEEEAVLVQGSIMVSKAKRMAKEKAKGKAREKRVRFALPEVMVNGVPFKTGAE